jgi:hypothetical protein
MLLPSRRVAAMTAGWFLQMFVHAQQDALCRHWCQGGELNGYCNDALCSNCFWCAELPPASMAEQAAAEAVCRRQNEFVLLLLQSVDANLSLVRRLG